ncbi:MAG: relaxase MobL [Oscillospiraceae bacterium]
MSQGVLFKQRYSSRNKPATAVLNVKHLLYIATRKGVRENEGCGFGLWGRLPEMKTAENLNNLKTAQRIVMDASKQNHTLYRVVLSVDADTAGQKALYDRAPWQKLVTDHIAVLAKEMEIAQRDFCWTAAMHYAKGHPHVHVMYWDNSDKVREEFIPPQRFEMMAEKVRAAFGREIYREELQPLWAEERSASKEARQELQAMCREANLQGALNLNNVSNEKLDELTAAYRDLALALPKTGSLDYDYIVTKVPQLTAFLDRVMEISDFQKLQLRCEKLSQQERRFYGNGEDTAQFELESVRKKLYKELGNGTLAVLRDELKNLQAEAPTEYAALTAKVAGTARHLIAENPDYQALVKFFPKLRTPLHEVLKDADFQKAKRVQSLR